MPGSAPWGVLPAAAQLLSVSTTPKSGSDANGTTTEAVSLVSRISATDVNGTTTELGSVGSIPISASDTGAGADSQTVTVPISDFEFGMGTENPIVARDDFGRTAGLGPNWGTADVGGAWTDLEGPDSYSVANNMGVITTAGLSIQTTSELGSVNIDDFEVLGKIRWTDTAAGGVLNAGSILARCLDVSNYYQAILRIDNTTQNLTLEIRRHLAGVSAGLGSPFTLATAYTPGEWWWIRFSVIGTTLRAKAWREGTTEPAYQISLTDTNHTTGSPGYKLSFSSGSTVFPTVYLDYFRTTDQSLVAGNTLRNVTSTVDTGTDSESATLVAPISVTDVNGTTTETATPNAAISTADANGATTETQLVTVPVSASDTGAGADTATLKAVYTSADTATDSESATLVATGISSSDVGVGADAQTPKAAYTDAEIGNGVEGITDRKTATPEIAGGADSQSVLTPGAAADNEFGSGSDVANVSKAVLTTTDIGAGAEAISTFALVVTETSTGADSQTVQTPGVISGSDVGVGVDAISALKSVSAEIGSGIDAQTEIVKLTVAETGAGSEAQAVTVPVSAADTGVGINAQSLSAAFSQPETASGLDSATTGIARLTTAESASGIELQILQARLSSFDISTGVDYAAVETGIFLTADAPQWMIDARIDGTLIDVVIASKMKNAGIAKPTLIDVVVEDGELNVPQLNTPMLTNAKVE